jgi:glycosyltransferase involved in cell wall biosynthesis
MKIVVTGTRGIPNILGGVETHCEELFPHIVAMGYDVTVIRRKSYVQDELKEYKGIKLIDLKTPKKKSLEAIIHTLKAIGRAKKLQADVIHIHAVGPALLTPLARLFGLKVVFTHHGPDYDRDKWGGFAKNILKLGERFGCTFADEVIVISEVINKFIKEKYKRIDAHLIYNGVPTPEFISDTSYLDSLGIQSQDYIFAMGRFVPEKNFHQLISAFSLQPGKDRCKLVLAGAADFKDNYSDELKELARKNGVILTGFIKGEKLHVLLTHARTFVLPSSHEGLPISLLEAMSYNLPVIVSNIPANLAVGLPAECYFKVGDETDLAQHLTQAINEQPQPVKYNMDDYNWQYIAEKVMAVYNGLFS